MRIICERARLLFYLKMFKMRLTAKLCLNKLWSLVVPKTLSLAKVRQGRGEKGKSGRPGYGRGGMKRE